jgi:hypothetical protein
MKLTIGIFFLSFLMAIVFAATIQENAADILAKAKQASGGAEWDRIVSIYTKAKITTSGLSGLAESWDDVIRGRGYSRFELGPLTGAQGFDGKTLWTQDPSKQVKAEEGGDAREGAMNEAYRRCMAYWFPQRWEGQVEYAGQKEEGDRSFYMIKITPRGGRVFDLWIDARTFLVDRTVEKAAIETRTTYFSDYRLTSGVKIPFYSRSTNGEERYDQLISVEKVEFNVPLTDEMFRMPAPPSLDFVMSGGKNSTTFPFSLYNNHIYIQAGLNGKGPFELLCDTGGANIITPELAQELGLKPEGKLQGRGVGEKSEDVGLAKIETLQVGDATLSNQLFAVFPLSSMSSVEGMPMQGLIGYEVFKRFVVTIDYERGQLSLTLPSAFSYQGSGIVVPFKFNQQIPEVDGQIDGLPGKFDIDTGSRASLTILAPFAEKENLKARYGAKIDAMTGWGIGGPTRGLITRAKVLKLGEATVEGPLMDLSLQTKGAFTDSYVAGNVGGGVLKRFNIVFDYGQQQLIFEKNANYSRPDIYDRAGMWLNLVNGAFQVVDVTAGGPAAEAGLKVGDSILAVDEKSPAELSLPAVRTMFRTEAPGTKIKLLVLSGGTKRELVISLRDVI